MMSESNKQQAVNKLTEIVANFTAMISTRMPDDVVDKLKQLKDAETSSMGKIIYHTMFDNMQKAIDLNRPACQDTGEIMFFVKVGSRFPLLGELQSILKQAVEEATVKAPLRHNAVEIFDEVNTSPQAVILEITEEQAFSNAESSMYNIEQLHKFGFRIAIDDFGTGYANYERLKRLQADIIKIDGVFVKDIVTNTLDAMIVRSITDLAKAKSLSVVAEFVETQQQQALLHKLGVQYLQGYLIGRPQPLAD